MAHKLWSFVRHKHYYFKLVTYLLVAALTPIFVLSLFFYNNVQDAMRGEVERANDRQLGQTVNSLEIVVKQINEGFRLFMTDRVVTDFELYSLGNYYNEFEDKYKSDDMPALMKYIESKAKLLESLDKLRSTSDFIDSVYYINNAKGLVFTSGYKQYAQAQFYDGGWNRELPPYAPSFPEIMDVRDAPRSDGTSLRVVPIVFQPFQATYRIVINLDAEALYRNFVSKLSGSGTTVSVFDKNGVPLFYDNEAGKMKLMRQAEQTIAAAADPASGSATPDERSGEKRNRLLISWKTSAMLGWKIASTTELNKLYESASYLHDFFLLVAAALILGMGGLTLFTSRSMYRPITRLMQALATGEPMSMHRSRGEFRVIGDRLSEAYATREQLQTRLRESLPAYQEKFVRSLVLGHSFTPQEITERFAYFGFDMRPEGIGVMYIAVDDTAMDAAADVETTEMARLLLADTISAAIHPANPRIVMEWFDGDMVVLMNGGENAISLVFETAGQIRRLLEERHGVSCTIGIGSYCAEIGQLPRAFREAEEAVSYRTLAAGGSEVIYIEDVRLEAQPPVFYPKERETSLLVYLKNGQRADALHVFAEMAKQLRESHGGAACFGQIAVWELGVQCVPEE
ncbi:PDC sensor domain-containing protein [Paenibacillus cymbidii]|uniref:PDC sensor domain-containing protein n=1 Tax=Paenibacillus cymbidii TaxID=1639034 RepID=UPI0010814129|nr:hypothetical protein [Paenibacillus cymbidii]